jgi:hypothetical protein
VFEDYCDDHEAWFELYPEVTQAYFNKIWREEFDDVRLRKHCRFTKCPFCVEHRAVMTNRNLSSATRQEARRKLKLHLAWAHKRERGCYMDKVSQACLEPEKYLSLAMDETDKFPNGFPHFFEITKTTDGKRLKVHVYVVMVHGSEAPYVYLGWENLKSDPNLVCECLNRTLQAEEILRGVLLDTLYIQTGNCIRENKNTYTEKFMEWLVERGVVKAIYTSFLPLGQHPFRL